MKVEEMMKFFNSLVEFGFHSQLRELHLVSNFMKCVELKDGIVIIPKLWQRC